MKREENFDPLRQVRLASKWAEMHGLDFPKVPVLEPNESIKEVYVIKDEENIRAPVIIHFMLVNDTFRKFSSPGVKRKESDKDGDFMIYEHPTNVYSTFNFTYDQEVSYQYAVI